MWQFDTKFSEVIQRTREVKSFRFPVSSANAAFASGQFFFVTIKVKGQDALHHFTLSGSPTDQQYLEFTKRITSSDFSQTLNSTKPGDWAHVSGPAGSFILPAEPQPLAFVSGGIGITPLRSMLRYITAKQLPYDVVLLYGNNSYDDIVFRDELKDMENAHHSLRVEFVLSGGVVPPGWKGQTGMINQEMVRKVVPDFKQRLFFVSGPPKMVLALSEAIVGLGVAGDRVKRDSFTGYD